MRRDSPRYGNFPKRRKSRERPWNRASPAFGKLWEHARKCRVDLGHFTSISLKRKCQKFPMVIDEWQKDVSLQGIRWNDEHISQLIRDGLIRNFGDMYRVSIVQAGAAIEGWVDTLPTIHVQTKDSFVRNSELSFLISGEQITNSSIHLIIMVLLSPADANGQLLESDSLYKKVVAIKENHNPRIDTFISTMKNILITELENWINQFNNDQDIY